MQIIGAGAVLLLLGVAGRDILGGELRVGELVSLFLYGLVLVNPVGQLANVYGATQSARGAVQRLLDASSAAPEQDDGVLQSLPADGDIVYQGVTFGYPGA